MEKGEGGRRGVKQNSDGREINETEEEGGGERGKGGHFNH